LPEIVQEIGAYAGLASVLGLAVLSALYFSQARDVKRLREWAGRAPERSGLPGPPQTAPQRVVAQPQRPGQGPQPGQPRPGVPTVPGQQPPPAVPGAAQPAATGARPATSAPAAQGAVGNNAGGVPAQTPAAAGAQAPSRAGQPAVPGAPAQGGVAGQGPASAPTQIVPPGKPVTPAAQRPGPPAAVPVVPTGRAPASGVRLPNRSAPPPVTPAPEPSTPWYRTPRYVVLAIVGVLVVGGGAAFGLTQLGGSDSSSSSQPSQQAQGGNDGGDGARKQPAVNPASVTVAVLNGTTVPGLARQVSDDVQQRGFRVGNVDNSPDSSQQRAESVVQFARGHRREAVALARRLKIGQREPIDPSVQQLAGDATVVVIAGQDQNQTP
jgi:hypothetical protein